MTTAEHHHTSQWSDVLMNTYGTPHLKVVKGQGATLYSDTGDDYIDFLGGIAVNSMGYAHPNVVEAVSHQVAELAHVSNILASPPVIELGSHLIERFVQAAQGTPCKDEVSDTSRVFFCNSGAEANEAAFKIARATGRSRILAAKMGFHGRTMGSLALTGQPDKRKKFEPVAAGVEYYPYNDLDYVTKLVEINAEDVAAIFLEPIQGETGVIPADPEFLQGLRALCDKYGILLVVDEVQTGIGRTGQFFGFEAARIVPDVITMAKGLGAGLPIGACMARGNAAKLLGPGDHGTTFGGNPVCCAAGNAVLRTIDDVFLERVQEAGDLIRKRLLSIELVESIRGRGLMLGAVLNKPLAKEIVNKAWEHGVILNAPSDTVLRFVPPLVITDQEITLGLDRLEATIADVKKEVDQND